MPKLRKPSNRSEGPGEKERFEILLKEVRSQQKLILEGITELKERVERVEFRLGRLEQVCDGFQTAIIAHSNEIRRLQHDVQVLQHEVAKLTERFEEYVKTHA